MNRVLNLLRSVRFNILLGLLIALFSAVGTLLPQLPETPEKVNAYQLAHPQWSRLFDFLGLFNLYQSWWFMGLLGLMALDIVLCKLWKTPPDTGLIALPPEFAGEAEIERHLARKEAALRLKPYQATFGADLASPEARTKAKKFLVASGFSLQDEVSLSSGAGAFVATRHGLQRWGSYLAHIGLVVILLGSLVKGLWGFVEMVPVLEGGSRAMQYKPDWEIYVDKFTVKYYDGTFTPKHFSSVMRVQKGDDVLGKKTILVNDPLDIGGVRFYQASWGAGGMFRSVTLDLGKRKVQMAQRTPTKIGGSPIMVKADVMLPNFQITPEGTADSGSLDFKNPAVRFVFIIGPHQTAPLWLLKDHPDLCFAERPDGVLEKAPPPPFKLAEIDPVLFSGIQVAYDPGYKIVVVGSLLWLFGSTALFYLHRRRLWVLIEPREASTAVTVGGWSSRGPKEFEKEFKHLVLGLGRSVGAEDVKISCGQLAEA